LFLSLVNFYYNLKSKPKTSIILTTCIEEVGKHKLTLTGEEVKKIKNYVCEK
jgi:hypothetical protein